MKRVVVGLVSGVLAVSAWAAPRIFAQAAAPEMAPVALGFETMAAVSGAYVGAPNPIRTIPGGGLPWIISSAQGELRVEGELTVSVRGWSWHKPNRCQAISRAPIRYPHSTPS